MLRRSTKEVISEAMISSINLEVEHRRDMGLKFTGLSAFGIFGMGLTILLFQMLGI